MKKLVPLWLLATLIPLTVFAFTLIPDSLMNKLGANSFDGMKKQMKVVKEPDVNNYVRCITDALLEHADDNTGVKKWEVVVFDDDSANAFALPGGKIGVHTGLLKIAKTPDQLAAVIGHEIGHVLERHGNARMSQSGLVFGGLFLADKLLDTTDLEYQKEIMSVLGVGAQVGVLLPYSRKHESKADRVGLKLMSKAGFNPRASVELWQNMAKASGGQPPEFLSTHPSHGSRIDNLNSRMADAMSRYESAKSKGQAPNCKVPS